MTTATHFSNFNASHWLKVKAERIQRGLPIHPECGQEYPHALTGKTLIDAETGQAWRVKRIQKEWLQGWYLVAFIEHDGICTQIVIDSLVCYNSDIQKQVHFFEQNFHVRH